MTTVSELHALLGDEVKAGRGHWPVYKSADEEGNGFEAVDEIEVKTWADFDHETFVWDDDLPEANVVVIW